ncbi:MAG: hypothetical protein JXA10_00885, partial [Anaerolineae bacterium]|nr:hypothetical protein [Anaerolineae bacterium]
LPTLPPAPTQLVNQASVNVAAQVPAVSNMTASPATTVANAGGVVNTPVPSSTPIPLPTALPSPTPFVCQEREGTLIQNSFYSAIAGSAVDYQLYLPPCFYETFRRYPFVILLHGSNYTDTMWVDLGVVDAMNQGITKGALPPMVLVMPNGGTLFEYNDMPDGLSWESVILQELIPTMESNFCLWADRQGRAIGGISRGGFWAFSIALHHPEVFSILGGHSPHFQPDNALPQNNPLDLAQSVYLEKYPLRIYMDNGASDYVGTFAIQMSEILRERGIDHQYLINPTGDHTMEYWSSHVAEYLSFYGQTWPYSHDALPSCLDVLSGS